MNTGHWLAVFLIGSLAIFAIWDVWAFVKGKTTMSQWVIKSSKANKYVAYWWLFFVIGITGVMFWLFFHWELNCIIFNFYCGLDV